MTTTTIAERQARQARKAARRQTLQTAAEATLQRLSKVPARDWERGTFAVPRGGRTREFIEFNAYDVFERALKEALAKHAANQPLNGEDRLVLNGAVTMTQYTDPFHFSRLVRLFAQELQRRGWE